MALPVVIVSSGGYPMNRLSVHGGLPVTLAAQGVAVTEAPAGYGTPMTFVTEGGSVVLPVPPVTYATWNSADKSATVVLSNGNLTATTSGGGYVNAASGKSSGKYYFELTVVTQTNTNTYVGLGFLGGAAKVYTNVLGAVKIGASGTAIALGLITNGTPVGIAVNLTPNLIWFRNGPAGLWNSNASNNPATGIGGVDFSSVAGTQYPVFGCTTTGQVCTANLGASAFAGTVPSGFTAGWPT